MRQYFYMLLLCISMVFAMCFATLLVYAKKPSPENPSLSASAESYGVMIIGVIASKDVKKSVVLIKEIESKKVQPLKIGYLLLGKYPVLKISQKSVVVRDQKQYVELFKDKFAVTSAGKNAVVQKSKQRSMGDYSEDGMNRKTRDGEIDIQITSAYRDNMVKNQLQTILMSAAATPYVEGGKIQGFKITDITPGSIFEKAGFLDGDIVTVINGISLVSSSGAIRVLRGLKQVESVDVQIVRSGESMDMTISVK